MRTLKVNIIPPYTGLVPRLLPSFLSDMRQITPVDNFGETFNSFIPNLCRRESRPLVGKGSLVNVQPQIPVLYTRVAGYFSQAVWWEKMASMSAKRTQFSFPLCCSFPAVSSKSFIATMYGLIYSSHLSANQELYLALFPWC